MQTEVVAAFGDDDFPDPAPPASAAAIARAEAHAGFRFPPSYREFLEVADGVRNVANEMDLVGVQGILGAEYASLIAELRDLGWRIGERLLVEGFIVGCRSGRRSVFVMDRSVEPDEHGELPVVYWSDQVVMSAQSFREFLQQWCDVVDELLADAREKARETPRGFPIRRPPPSS
jgi:hypothetical protein